MLTLLHGNPSSTGCFHLSDRNMAVEKFNAVLIRLFPGGKEARRGVERVPDSSVLVVIVEVPQQLVAQQ